MQAHGDRGQRQGRQVGIWEIQNSDEEKKKFTLRMIKCSGRLPGKKWNVHPWRDSVVTWR